MLLTVSRKRGNAQQFLHSSANERAVYPNLLSHHAMLYRVSILGEADDDLAKRLGNDRRALRVRKR
jgi:hypothetical protein